MMTRTRLVLASEPDPLAEVTIRTMSRLLPCADSVDSLLGRIDEALSSFAAEPIDPLIDAERNRTLLRHEADPLAVPPRAARAPSGLTKGASERAAHLDRCLDALQGWLGVGLVDVCQAAGINRGTVYAWRARGSAPRPGTVSGVLRLHGLVSSAVSVIGEASAREWFHAGHPSPLDRMKAAAGDSGASSVIGRELRRALTGPALPPPNPLLVATLDDSPARPLA